MSLSRFAGLAKFFGNDRLVAETRKKRCSWGLGGKERTDGACVSVTIAFHLHARPVADPIYKEDWMGGRMDRFRNDEALRGRVFGLSIH